jgi:FAD/FMN-containing dehydrogenase
MTTSVGTPQREATYQLRSSMRGAVLLPDEAGYDEARRLWNGAVDARPAAIACCEDRDDVAAALRAAREHGMPLSVRGGGHDWGGRALNDGGVVIDLRPMRAVRVDADAGVAVAQGGATAGDVVAAAGRFGLVPVTGTVKAVGMAGFTLGGGYGPLCGKHGLGVDNLVGAEVVLADGRIVTADDSHEPDLLWGLRGGGGGFGVVSTARYRLHRLGSVTAGLILFGLGEAARVLRGYQERIATAPDELTVMSGFLSGPDGNPLLFLFPTWSGEPAEGEREIARLEQLGTPVMTQVAPMAYEDTLGMFDAQVVNGRHHLLRTRWLAELTDETVAVLMEAARTFSSSMSVIALHHFHGAAARVPTPDTAFGLRRDHLLVEILAAWDPATSADRARHEAWANRISDTLAAHALPGGYPNLLGPDEQERAELAYGTNARRLRELKRRYDPAGLFASAIGALPLVAR